MDNLCIYIKLRIKLDDISIGVKKNSGIFLVNAEDVQIIRLMSKMKFGF